VTFVNTSCLEATADFYGRMLQLPLVYESPGFVLFYRVAPNSYLGVCLRGSREAGDVKGAIPTFVCQSRAEVDSWQEKLEKLGIAIEKRAGLGISSDGKHIPTIYNLFIRDPAGYLVEFQVFLDPAWPPIERPLATAKGAELIGMTASAVVAKLRAREVAPCQCIDAFAAQHVRTEAAVDAVPILCIERARAAALALGARPPSPLPPGYLHGLPVVVKDLSAVAGVRFVRGSPIYRSAVAEVSHPDVLTLEAKGAVVVGKSNTPEFGAGSQTFNPVFGPTNNPFDVRRTAGGSSGGAAAALASGTAWLATGSDLGGSLRIPAAFCGVYGFRVSPGRIARNTDTPSGPFVSLHTITGPMARTVADLALLLDAMIDYDLAPRQVGWDFDAPFNFPAGATCYGDCTAPSIAAEIRPVRIAWSADLNGLISGALDVEALELCKAAAHWFSQSSEGATVTDGVCPDLSDARMIFNLLRGESFAETLRDEWATARNLLKPEVCWNIALGHVATAKPDSLDRARAAHAKLFQGVERFFEDYDMLVTPTVLMPPFDVGIRYPSRVAEVQFDNYVDWMVLSWATTVTQCPILAMPIGLTKAGLPVGLQLIAKPFSEPTLLAAAAAFEAAHPEIAGLVPLQAPRRLENELEAAIVGPRTAKRARLHAEAEAASFEAMLKPAALGTSFFRPVSPTCDSDG